MPDHTSQPPDRPSGENDSIAADRRFSGTRNQEHSMIRTTMAVSRTSSRVMLILRRIGAGFYQRPDIIRDAARSIKRAVEGGRGREVP